MLEAFVFATVLLGFFGMILKSSAYMFLLWLLPWHSSQP